MGEVFKIDKIASDGHDPELVVVDTEPEHVRILGGNLRQRDIEIANKAGIPPHRALWKVYRRSLMAKTVFVDGMIVAIFGVCGTWLGKTGKPWFTASPYVEGYPMKMAFRYRSEVRNMLKYFPILEDFVSIEDDKTIRLLSILGFKFEKDQKKMGNATLVRATLER